MPTGSDPAVRVDGLHVTFRVKPTGPTRLRAIVAGRGTGAPVRRVQALRGISLDIPRGEVLGVIGRNGAGKSTLLRAIAGIIPPSEGSVTTVGEVGALLELGAAFNPQLTGRRNAALAAMTSGHSRSEVAARMDDIVAFADLGEFIDYPVQTYSTGMRGRLGFATAAIMDPDVLLVDEGLATGDAAFRRKCLDHIRAMCEGDATVVMVSHQMDTLRDLAARGIWLDAGHVRMDGPMDEVADAYEAAV